MTALWSPPAPARPAPVRRLLSSSTFRLVFLGALLFAVTSVGLLAVIRVAVGSLLDQQVDFTIDGETDRLRQVMAEGGLPALTGELSVRMSSLQGRGRIYLLVDRADEPLIGNLTAWPATKATGNNRIRFTVPAHLDDAGSRVRGAVMDLGTDGRLLVGRVQTDRALFDQVIGRTMVAGGVVSLLLGVVVGLLMARNVLRRLDAVNGTVEAILHDEIGGRVPESGSGDEFDRLAVKLNGMLDRIDGLMTAMREVTRNIAHDLRTPLNRLRNRLELALLAGEGGSEGGRELGAAIRDVDAIIATFNALLSIARVEGRLPREQFRDVALERVVEDVADLYRPLAEDDGLTFEVAAEPGLLVSGDGHLLFQAIANLVDNAVKYTPPGGRVRLEASARRNQVRLVVADSGPGIPASEREAVLRPFTRLDASRHHPGMGLGLSMVAAIVTLHEARLAFEDNAPGLRAVLTFAASLQPNRPVM